MSTGKSKKALTAAAMAAVFTVTFGLAHWLGDPKGNPDHALLYGVAAVLGLAAAMLVRELMNPRRFTGDSTGLGAFRISLAVSVLTLFIAGLGVAFAVLRHPVVAGFISGAAFAALIFHAVISGLLAKICWGVPFATRPTACTIWRARVAELISAEKNETTLARLSELLVACARQPENPKNAASDKELCAVNLRIEEELSELRALVSGGAPLSQIDEKIASLESALGERLNRLSGGGV